MSTNRGNCWGLGAVRQGDYKRRINGDCPQSFNNEALHRCPLVDPLIWRSRLLILKEKKLRSRQRFRLFRLISPMRTSSTSSQAYCRAVPSRAQVTHHPPMALPFLSVTHTTTPSQDRTRRSFPVGTPHASKTSRRLLWRQPANRMHPRFKGRPKASTPWSNRVVRHGGSSLLARAKIDTVSGTTSLGVDVNVN